MSRKERNSKKERNPLKDIPRIDFNIWVVTLLLCFFGAIMIYSASAYECSLSSQYNYDSMALFKRQNLFIFIGIVVMLFGRHANYNLLNKVAWLAYLGSQSCIFLLIPFGVEVNGAKRWLNMIFFQFQVAEVVKISVIIFLAYMVKKYYKHLSKIKLTIYMWIAGAIPAGLLFVISNDLSSALVVLGITFLVTLVCTGTHKLHLAALVIVVSIAAFYVYGIATHLPTAEEITELPFREARIAAWIAPERYAQGPGYQVLQALYAIGSGGFLGKGFGNSIQKLGAIPEAQNDMIFAIICEELGVVGAGLVLGLIAYLLYQILKVAMHTKDVFGAALALGIFAHIGLQTIINVAVNCNLFPNTGLPLPFFSYGGTSVFLLLLEIMITLCIEQHNIIRYLNRQELLLYKNGMQKKVTSIVEK